MFLKTLQIKGFKSFADSASLELEPGVTVVVGPNGSGKSNVVDAIGWVLGAQAPSAVRSQKMDDVIFAGSAKRPALGRAEVSLTIDNSSGILPIDFTEVTITRALFRSGDSEYAINGVSCRLLDIQELLTDSGVGRQQHVIISQGQIDAVLNAKPEDRRLIIEEAAGVLKFRRRKEKAERRLASTEANLTRIHDLLREVRRQLRPLERQADAARRHGQVQAELLALRIHLAGRELVRLRTQQAESTAAQQELRGKDRELRSELAKLDAEILDVEAQLSGLGGQEYGDALVRYESLRERARGLAALIVERHRGIERDREAFVDAGVVASLEAEHARLVADLEAADAEVASLEPDQARLVEAEAALAEARAAVRARLGRRRRRRRRRGRRGPRRAGGAGRRDRALARRPHPPRASRTSRWPRRSSGWSRSSPASSTESAAGRWSRRRAHDAREREPGCRPTRPRPRSATAELEEASCRRRAASLGGPGRGACRWHSTRPANAPAPTTSPSSTACSAPCSTWSRSSPAGRRRSRPPSPRRSTPWSSPTSTSPARALAVAVEGLAVGRGARARRPGPLVAAAAGR